MLSSGIEMNEDIIASKVADTKENALLCLAVADDEKVSAQQ